MLHKPHLSLTLNLDEPAVLRLPNTCPCAHQCVYVCSGCREVPTFVDIYFDIYCGAFSLFVCVCLIFPSLLISLKSHANKLAL